jgi:hypothetical protein
LPVRTIGIRWAISGKGGSPSAMASVTTAKTATPARCSEGRMNGAASASSSGRAPT